MTTAHNPRVNPTGGTVTGLAKTAGPAPAHPAGDAERWADKARLERNSRGTLDAT